MLSFFRMLLTSDDLSFSWVKLWSGPTCLAPRRVLSRCTAAGVAIDKRCAGSVALGAAGSRHACGGPERQLLRQHDAARSHHVGLRRTPLTTGSSGGYQPASIPGRRGACCCAPALSRCSSCPWKLARCAVFVPLHVAMACCRWGTGQPQFPHLLYCIYILRSNVSIQNDVHSGVDLCLLTLATIITRRRRCAA